MIRCFICCFMEDVFFFLFFFVGRKKIESKSIFSIQKKNKNLFIQLKADVFCLFVCLFLLFFCVNAIFLHWNGKFISGAWQNTSEQKKNVHQKYFDPCRAPPNRLNPFESWWELLVQYCIVWLCWSTGWNHPCFH